MDDNKKPRSREVNGTVYSPWFSRDGKTVRYPEELDLEELARLRRASRPMVLFRLLDFQNDQFLFRLPDHPDVPPLRLELPRDGGSPGDEG